MTNNDTVIQNNVKMVPLRVETHCFLCGEPCEPFERGTHHLCEIAERTLTTAYETAIVEENKERQRKDRRSNADHGKVA